MLTLNAAERVRIKGCSLVRNQVQADIGNGYTPNVDRVSGREESELPIVADDGGDADASAKNYDATLPAVNICRTLGRVKLDLVRTCRAAQSAWVQIS